MSYRRDQPARRSAAEEMLAADHFRDLPLGGYAGEVIAPTSEAPPPAQLDPGLVLEAPPWRDAELELPALAPMPAPTDGLNPVEMMKLEDGDVPELPPPAPAVVNAPLQRFVPPEPDWSEEERLRLTRQAEEAEHESARSLQPRPA